MEADGFTSVDGGAYTDGTTDFTSMITKFKARNCQYLSNCPLPPDFNIFWRQANQQGWKPRLATVAKVLLFPADTVRARAAGQQHRHRLVVGPVHALPLPRWSTG